MGGPRGRLDQVQVRRRAVMSLARLLYLLMQHVISSRLEWPREHYFPPCPLHFRDGWEPPPLAAEPSDLTPRNQRALLEQQEVGAGNYIKWLLHFFSCFF